MPAAKRKIVVTLDTYLSTLAVVSSFCAIGITFYQAYLQRTQQYASVMPVLDSYLNDGGDARNWLLTFVFINNGVGPAFIQKAEITYKQKLYPDIRRVVRAIVDEKLMRQTDGVVNVGDYSVQQSGLYPTRIMPVGQEVQLCHIEHKYVARWVDEAILRGDIRVKIWYKSIYGEQWRFDTAPERIETRNVKIND